MYRIGLWINDKNSWQHGTTGLGLWFIKLIEAFLGCITYRCHILEANRGKLQTEAGKKQTRRLAAKNLKIDKSYCDNTMNISYGCFDLKNIP